MLDDLPEVMVIFNHPLWDPPPSRNGLIQISDLPGGTFAREYGRYLDAFGPNATGSCEENEGIVDLAERWQRMR